MLERKKHNSMSADNEVIVNKHLPSFLTSEVGRAQKLAATSCLVLRRQQKP